MAANSNLVINIFMETSLKLQLDVRNNAQDLENYMLDLNNWEEEMKRKESELNKESLAEITVPPPRNKIKRSKPEDEKNPSKPKKISAYDYSAWDKFDVEKACADIDEIEKKEITLKEEANETKLLSSSEENDNGSTSKSKDFSLVDEAFYEKEMGNKFVKEEKWDEALKCYTNAINLDPTNAIYCANRSLCFLKLKNLKAAETDATAAIQLDKTYVKAYQRRAFARLALGQLAEAKCDYEEILKLEPKNALARVEIMKIDEKLNDLNGKPVEKKIFNPKNMFKSEEGKVETKATNGALKKEQQIQKNTSLTQNKPDTSNLNSKNVVEKCTNENKKIVDDKKNVSSNEIVKFDEGGDVDKEVQSQSTKSKLDVFRPLPEWCKLINPINIPPHKRSKKSLRKINVSLVDKDEDYLSVEEKNPESSILIDENNKNAVVNKPLVYEELKNERVSLEIPKTAIQFQKSWKILKKTPEEAYSYLKKIPGSELPKIFEISLESDFFSDLITFLANEDVKKDPDVVYSFLLGLSSVKRFSSLTLFMSETDRKNVEKSLTELESVKSKEEISKLRKLYEL